MNIVKDDQTPINVECAKKHFAFLKYLGHSDTGVKENKVRNNNGNAHS